MPRHMGWRLAILPLITVSAFLSQPTARTPTQPIQQQQHVALWLQCQHQQYHRTKRRLDNWPLRLADEVFPTKVPGFELRRVSDPDETGQGRYGVKGMVALADYRRTYQDTQAEYKKQAKFKGFRAGKIPPGMMVAVREYAVSMAIENAVVNTLMSYGLEAVVPENEILDLKVNSPGDITAFARAYNGKEEFDFDAEVEAKGEPKVGDEKEKETDGQGETEGRREEEDQVVDVPAAKVEA